MSARFDQRWACERLLDFALTFDTTSVEMRELREGKVSAQRIFKLYPLDMNDWVQPMRAAFQNEAIAKAVWLESNTFDTYRHILKQIHPVEDQAHVSAAKWNRALRQKGDSIAVTNAAWNAAIFLTVLDYLANTEDWLELHRNELLLSRMGDFENLMARVLEKAASA